MQASGGKQVCGVEGAAKAVSLFWNGSYFPMACRSVSGGGGGGAQFCLALDYVMFIISLILLVLGTDVLFFRFMLSGIGSSGLTAGAHVTTTVTVLRNIHFSGVGVCVSGIDSRVVHMK